MTEAAVRLIDGAEASEEPNVERTVRCDIEGPPWPVALSALHTPGWVDAREAFSRTTELMAFARQLVARLESDFPPALPPARQRDDGSFGGEPEKGRGWSWQALQRPGSGGVSERAFLLEAEGLSAGRRLGLTWSDLPGERAVELTLFAPKADADALEPLLRAMVADKVRPVTVGVRRELIPGATSRLDPRYDLRSVVIASSLGVIVSLVGGLLFFGGAGALTTAWRVRRFPVVNGEVVSVKAVVAPEPWGGSTHWSSDVVPEIEVSYPHGGRTYRMTFVDTSLRRSMPAVVRALGDREWRGRSIPLFVDPWAPERAFRERYQPWKAPMVKLLVGGGVLSVGLALLLGALFDLLFELRRTRKAAPKL